MRWQLDLVKTGLVLLYVVSSALFFVDMRDIPRSNDCGMTYSAPIYKPLIFTEPDATMAHTYVKYTLAQLYMQGDTRQKKVLTGAPMLFVPGHLGSYKQARSLGQHLTDLYLEGYTESYDLFLLDFNEEATGVTGHFVLEQGFFLNEAVKEILSIYKRQQEAKVTAALLPTSVVVVAHSMGGIVTRTALTLPNYAHNSIETIITLSTPHVAPPFNLDASMSDVYSTLNRKRNDTADVVLVSLAGGIKDFVIHSSLATIDHVIPSSHGFSALTSLLPNVTASMDHLCILWCHQFIRALSSSLVSLIDPASHQVRRPIADRLEKLQTILVGADADIKAHHDHVARGYTEQEMEAHVVYSPAFSLYIFRTHYLIPFPLLALIALAMLVTEIERWQQDDLSQPPTFASLLSPKQHWSSLLRHVLHQTKLDDAPWKRNVAGGALFIAMIAMHIMNAISLAPLGVIFLCYTFLLGFLHLIVGVMSCLPGLPFRYTPSVSRRGFSPVALSVVASLVIIGAHGFLQLGFDASREFALVYLSLIVLHVYIVVSLAILPTASNATYQRIVFAFYCAISPCWIGDFIYFADVVRYPRAMSFNFVWYFIRATLVTLPGFFHAFIARKYGFPSTPAAVFAHLQGIRRPTNAVQGSAEECTSCFIEDGGPGAIFIEVETPATIHYPEANVTLGPTFRVVACDCGMRNMPTKDFCAFCRRLCNYCGGGELARQDARQFRDYMHSVQDQVLAHQGVPGVLWFILLLGFLAVAQGPHALLYVGAAVGTVCSLYHMGLRSPLDLEVFDVVKHVYRTTEPVMEEVKR